MYKLYVSIYSITILIPYNFLFLLVLFFFFGEKPRKPTRFLKNLENLLGFLGFRKGGETVWI